MHIFELYNIAEPYMEIINPFNREKLKTIGRYAGMKEGTRVIEFGCGFAEVLVIWAEEFGITGEGVEIREYAYERGVKKIEERGLSDRIKLVCQDGSKYEFEKGAFDVAACVGASFIWGDYQKTISAMKEAIKPKGKLIIGEPYLLKVPVPPEYEEAKGVHSEYELLRIAREEGFDFEYMVRANSDDWDRYETTNWRGLVKWLEENPQHPDKTEVLDWFHMLQDDYLKYGREYLGWAVYILNPVRY
jgi:SAM-dependent methyltransferase